MTQANTAHQIDLEELTGVPDNDPLISKTYTFPRSQLDVHDAAHELVEMTMNAGRTANGQDTWRGKDALSWHVWKGLKHVLNIWHTKSIASREGEEPRMLDMGNAVTRFCMAWALYKVRKSIAESQEQQED